MIPAIIIPTLNQHDRCRELLKTIDRPVQDLVIVNNNREITFEPDQPELVKRMTVVNSPANLGVASSWNLGIKMTPFAEWWVILNDDVLLGDGCLAGFEENIAHDRLLLMKEWPHWFAFALGDSVVQSVGLFDEAIHPANFEDDDYFWRCEKRGIETIFLMGMPHDHVGQATVHSPAIVHRKQATYLSNERYLDDKIAREDYSSGEWSLQRRRTNTVD